MTKKNEDNNPPPPGPEPTPEEKDQEEPVKQEDLEPEEEPGKEELPPGDPDVLPIHKEKNVSYEGLLGMINNNLEGVQNLAKAMSEGFKKIQEQDINRYNQMRVQEEERSAKFDQRLDNSEQSMVKLVEFIKAQAGAGAPPPQQQQPMQQPPMQQPAPGELIPIPYPQAQASSDPLSAALGPILGGMVTKGLTDEVKDPYRAIGEAVLNNQLKALSDPDGDPFRMIGKEVVRKITDQGVNDILNPQGTTYDDAYLRAKAKEDAKRDAARDAKTPPDPE